MLPTMGLMMLFPEVIGGRITQLEIRGFGSGDLMEPGWYWWEDPPDLPVPTGETARVYLHQKALIDEDNIQTWPDEDVIVY